MFVQIVNPAILINPKTGLNVKHAGATMQFGTIFQFSRMVWLPFFGSSTR